MIRISCLSLVPRPFIDLCRRSAKKSGLFRTTFTSLTDGPQSLLQVSRELSLDRIVDVVTREILVLLEDGSQLRERAGTQHSIEYRLVCSKSQLAYKINDS
ncbi:unnamed protein product [Leptidea sinapis]|uniref:Uncharacterized protein n=1 Tax=Leptidea sinapis TaxID=189913 RepID=A0A5E4PXU3_9NEOP|nr:unnamed protein product [Leptidea sinapis]